MSYLMYPQVFLDYEKFVKLYDNTSVIPTPAFLYGMQSGDEISVEIEAGKTLIIRYLTTGDARPDGLRTVFFELNGQPREVNVPDRSLEATLQKNPKAFKVILLLLPLLGLWSYPAIFLLLLPLYNLIRDCIDRRRWLSEMSFYLVSYILMLGMVYLFDFRVSLPHLMEVFWHDYFISFDSLLVCMCVRKRHE